MFSTLQTTPITSQFQNHYIIFTTVEKLNIILKTNQILSSQIKINQKTFTRGPSFSSRLLEKAIEFCQEYSQQQLLSLIVDHQTHVTIWLEKYQDSLTTKQNHKSQLEKNHQKTSKTLLKQYRGFVYKSKKTPKTLAKIENLIEEKTYRGINY